MMRFADGIPQSGPTGPNVALHADCREVTIPRERVRAKAILRPGASAAAPMPPCRIDPTGEISRNFCAITRRWAMLCHSFTSTAGSCIRPGRLGVMADLLRRVAERADTTAFRELYQTYGPRVKAYMMRLGADAGTAEDLAHETLFTVWRRAALYTPEKGSTASWIFAIARNLRIDRLRREVPWQQLPQGRLAEASSEPLPDEAMAEKERQLRVQAALAGLPPEQKEVVSLAYLEGLSHSEIADRLGLPL